MNKVVIQVTSLLRFIAARVSLRSSQLTLKAGENLPKKQTKYIPHEAFRLPEVNVCDSGYISSVIFLENSPMAYPGCKVRITQMLHPFLKSSYLQSFRKPFSTQEASDGDLICQKAFPATLLCFFHCISPRQHERKLLLPLYPVTQIVRLAALWHRTCNSPYDILIHSNGVLTTSSLIIDMTRAMGEVVPGELTDVSTCARQSPLSIRAQVSEQIDTEQTDHMQAAWKIMKRHHFHLSTVAMAAQLLCYQKPQSVMIMQDSDNVLLVSNNNRNTALTLNRSSP
ncbi:hypothetical protein F2P81_024348 [Scophthalmus maximus]|uniref:Uncharacterized protein n=1 Tax=Scophthalmus maximus TaxID=52904 RepID=A0A6A4RUK7_SCOMX|nr:hypothetical protein F2P81_024348 [Scophthalmus maximus]